MVAASLGFTLQICLIIALSLPCRCLRLGFVNGQVSLVWSIALSIQERWREERTDISSLNFSSRQFSHVLWSQAHNHRLQRACLLDSKRKLPPSACQAQLGLPSVVCHLRGVQFPGTVYTYNQGVRVLCQALEPTAFLGHPVLTILADDAVAAHSSAPDSAWEFV